MSSRVSHFLMYFLQDQRSRLKADQGFFDRDIESYTCSCPRDAADVLHLVMNSGLLIVKRPDDML